MDPNAEDKSFTLTCPAITGWNRSPEPPELTPNSKLTLTKGDITYEITIPEEEDAQKALQLALKEIERLTTVEEEKFSKTASEGSRFAGLAALPFSKLSRQFAYTVTLQASGKEQPITLTSPVASAEHGYIPYVQYNHKIYAGAGDQVFEITDPNAKTAESIAQKITSHNNSENPEGITDVTYDSSLTKQFQNLKQNEQNNIDGEKIARTFGIPYQRDMVFHIFGQLSHTDKAQFVVEQENKEELSPEQKFEDFQKGRYKYYGFEAAITEPTKASISIQEQHTLRIPTPSDKKYSDFCILLSSIEAEQSRKKVEEGEQAEKLLSLINIYGYENYYSSKLTENIVFTQVSPSFQIHEIKVGKEFEYFIKKINDTSKTLELFKITSGEKLSETHINEKINQLQATHISQDYIGILGVENQRIDIQKMSDYLKIPIINIEHAGKIYSTLTNEQKKDLVTQCLFDSTLQATNTAAVSGKSPKPEELQSNFVGAILRLHALTINKENQVCSKCLQQMLNHIGVKQMFENSGEFGIAWGKYTKDTNNYNETELNNLINMANNLVPPPAPPKVAKTTKKSTPSQEVAKKDIEKFQKNFRSITKSLHAAVGNEKYTELQKGTCQKALIGLKKVIDFEKEINNENIEDAIEQLKLKISYPQLGRRKYEKIEEEYIRANKTLSEIYLNSANGVLSADVKGSGSQNVIAINRMMFLSNLSLHAERAAPSRDCIIAAKPILKLLQDGVSENSEKFAIKDASRQQQEELIAILLTSKNNERPDEINKFFNKELFQGVHASLIKDIPQVAKAIASRSQQELSKTLELLEAKYKNVLSKEDLLHIFSLSAIAEKIQKIEKNVSTKSQNDSDFIAQETLANAMQERIGEYIKTRRENLASTLIKLFNDEPLANEAHLTLTSKLTESKEALLAARKKQQDFSDFLKALKNCAPEDYDILKKYLSSDLKERKELPSENSKLFKAFEVINNNAKDAPNELLFLKLLLSDALACPDVRLYLLHSLDGKPYEEPKYNFAEELSNRVGTQNVNNKTFIALQEITNQVKSLASEERKQLSILIKTMASSFGDVLDDSLVKSSAADFSECADYYKLLAHALYTPFPDEATNDKKIQIISSMIEPFLPMSSGTSVDGVNPLLQNLVNKVIELRKDNTEPLTESLTESLTEKLTELSKVFSKSTELRYKFSAEERAITALTPSQNIQGLLDQGNIETNGWQHLAIVNYTARAKKEEKPVTIEIKPADFTPAVVSATPASFEPTHFQEVKTQASSSKKSQSESKPTSALTNRLHSLIQSINDSTHPNVLLNDLLHENKKPSN